MRTPVHALKILASADKQKYRLAAVSIANGYGSFAQASGEAVENATLAFLTLASAGAGFVDAIAGGGGLITLPALLFAGVPANVAVATNKLQGTFGVAAASYRYYRAGLLAGSNLAAAIVATAAGAALGAFLVSRGIDVATLRAIMPYALAAAALYFAIAPVLREHLAHLRISPLAFALGAAGPAGFYDGVFGPGAGSLYTLAFFVLANGRLAEATARAKVLNFVSNAVSLAVFLNAGTIDFKAGFAMALGQTAGAWAGSQAAIKHGEAIVRPLLVVLTLAAAVKLWAWP